VKGHHHPNKKEIYLTNVLSALGDPIRLDIIFHLARAKEEVGWGEFEVCVGKATLSHHVKKLREAGLINHRKDGKKCYLSLRSEIDELFPGLLKSVLKVSRSK
jgi:DNA-binding transcriptional ArsR family regulator